MTPETARQHFPRGLLQPPNGFRFGMDALLLACFAARFGGNRVLDLGTGCGPVGLGFLLRFFGKDATVLGLDKEAAMVAAAQENARRLGLEDRFTAVELDIRGIRQRAELRPETFDLVLANPPYRHPRSGHRPADHSRDTARFETEGDLADFAAAAAYALINKGSLACIHLAERLTHIIAQCTANKLEIKTILPIAPRRDAPAKQLLLLARKNGRPGLQLAPTLALYEGENTNTRLTADALRFCPFLACNNSGLRVDAVPQIPDL